MEFVIQSKYLFALNGQIVEISIENDDLSQEQELFQSHSLFRSASF